jgi:large conductance mechanosensitive channel
MLQGFKNFILRGNVVDLAVGVVIGAAFSGVVDSLVKDILTPIIGAIAKVPDFSNWAFTVNESQFMIGSFINALIGFLLVAIAIYFFVVVPMNKLTTKFQKPVAEPTTKPCPECKSDIAKDAKRCAHCTQPVV